MVTLYIFCPHLEAFFDPPFQFCVNVIFGWLSKELFEREPVIPGGLPVQQAVPQVPHLSYGQQGWKDLTSIVGFLMALIQS